MNAKPKTTQSACECIIDADGWKTALPSSSQLGVRCLAAVQQQHHSAVSPDWGGEVCILFTDDATVQDLNQRFRQQDKPTNVLSFPGVQTEGHLGDIALAFETCQREAHEKSIDFEAHATHLIVHGLLHLIGYDHIEIDDAIVMETLEIQILKDLNIQNPYKDQENS